MKALVHIRSRKNGNPQITGATASKKKRSSLLSRCLKIPSILIALSGTDSAYLAWAAQRAPGDRGCH